MKTLLHISGVCFVVLGMNLAKADDGNPNIDYPAFLEISEEVHALRAKRRVSENKFIEMSKEGGTVILDTRSKDKYGKLHVKGAIHLNFSDFSEGALEKLIPDKNTRILIYCNNNFDNEPELLVTKFAPVALNIPTFINLHAYGYKNVYELKPLLDINTTRIPFAGSSTLKKEAN